MISFFFSNPTGPDSDQGARYPADGHFFAEYWYALILVMQRQVLAQVVAGPRTGSSMDPVGGDVPRCRARPRHSIIYKPT
jgi:hypothetical protein